MGQSAGAASVLHHAVLPRSQGLFSQGIAMSGYAVAWSLEEGYKRAAPIVKSLGCTDMSTRLECLQKVSTEEILKAEDSALFSAHAALSPYPPHCPSLCLSHFLSHSLRCRLR